MRQREAEQSSQTGEQRALDEELPDDPGTAGAERKSDSHLTCSLARAREQQVRDVRTR